MTCDSGKVVLTSLGENVMPNEALESFLNDLNDAIQSGDKNVDAKYVALKEVNTQVLIVCTVHTLDLMLKAFAAKPENYKESQLGSHVCFLGKIGDKKCVLVQSPNENKSERDGTFNLYYSAATVCKHDFAFAVDLK